jgi:glucose-6-phosphate isomerase
MIKVDISNIWSEVNLSDLLSIEAELSAAHMTVSERSGEGSELLGWMDLPDRAPTAEHMRILAAAHQIRTVDPLPGTAEDANTTLKKR